MINWSDVGCLVIDMKQNSIIAWKRFYADRQDWVIVPTVRPLSPASVMTPTTNFSSGSPATVSTYYIGCCQLNESSTTVYASAATTTSCPSELLCWKTKTSSSECCINLEIDCHNTPLTFISQCKLDSVLPVILIKFYVMWCYGSGLTAAAVGNRYGWLQHFLRSIIMLSRDTCDELPRVFSASKLRVSMYL